MNLELLLSTLEGKFQYYYSGPLQEDIYSVQEIVPGKETEPNVLYVAGQRSQMLIAQNTCLLCVPKEKTKDIVGALEHYIIQDYKRSIELIKLVKLLEESSIDELCGMAFDIMKNPTCILTPNGQIYASRGRSLIIENLVIIRKRIRDHMNINENRLVVFEEDEFPYKSLLIPIIHGERKTGYLYVIASERPFIDKWDEYYAHQIVEALSRKESLKPVNNFGTENQRFVVDLISGNFTDKEMIHRMMKHLGLRHKEAYCLLVVELRENNNSDICLAELSEILETTLCKYNNYGVALIGLDRIKGISEKDFPSLMMYLKEHEMYAGISSFFSDLTFSQNAYIQGKTSIVLRKILTDKVYLSFYEDLTGMHMYYLLDSFGIDISVFAHPIIEIIMTYDKEHGTQYIFSLAAYIFLNGSLQQAAEALFIHKNTLVNHIKMLEERFNIDFFNNREIASLRRTLEIYGYLGKINLQKLLGNEQ